MRMEMRDERRTLVEVHERALEASASRVMVWRGVAGIVLPHKGCAICAAEKAHRST